MFLEGLMEQIAGVGTYATVLVCSHRHTPLEARWRGPTHKQAEQTNRHAASQRKVSTVAPCASLRKETRFFL